MPNVAITPMPSPRLLIIKSSAGNQKFAGQAGYYLQGGRWHSVKQDKPAPKGAPVAAHPHAAGKHEPTKHFTDEQWSQLKLPDSNSNAGTFNKQLDKLKEHSEAGHVTGILASGYGSNTYGKKLSTIANHLLDKHGSEHKVEPGQKAGTHPAVQQAPAEKPKGGDDGWVNPVDAGVADFLDTLKPKQPSGGLSMPEFAEGKKATGVKDYYETIANTIIDAANEGNVEHLTSMPNKGKSWQGKTANSKKLVELHEAALKQAMGNQVDAPAAEPKPKPKVALKKKPAAPQAENSKGEQVEGKDLHKLPSGTVISITNPDGSHFRNALIKDGDVYFEKKVGTGWQKNPLAPQHVQGMVQGDYGTYHVVSKPDGGEKADKPADSPKPAPSTTDNVANIPWDGLKLPDSNSNAGTFNKKLSAIKEAAEAGDVNAILGMSFGVNTYGKKAATVANTALAALGSEHAVAHGQKAGEHAALSDDAPKPEPENPAPKDHLAQVASAFTATTADMFAHLHVENNGKTAEAYKEASDALAAAGHHKQAESLLSMSPSPPEKPSEEGGPKEGDTKEGADGTLVFKDGRWHKQDEAAGTDDASAEIVPIPTWEGATDKQSEQLQGLAETLLAKVKEQGKPALTGVLSKSPTKGKITIKVGGIHAKLPLNPTKPWAQNLVAFVEDLKTNAKDIHQQHHAAAAPHIDAAQPEPVAPTSPSKPESVDNWEQTGGQGGSNPGGKFKDENGVEWYCKFPGNEEHAKAEVLAANLYALTGVTGQDAKLITKDGKLGIASRWMDVKKANSPTALSKVDGVKSGFAVDAWLGNWDVVGLEFDNLQVGPDGKAARIDAGGSLMFRAQGAKKAFGDSVTELDSLRDASINPQSAKVFGKMTKADITASVAKVVNLSDDQIKGVVAQGQWGTPEERDELAATLIKRRDDLAAKHPKAAKMKPKKRLDPAKLPVDPDRLPKPHDFANWHSPGTGLSSQPHINVANNEVEQKAFEVAKTGNLHDLKDFTFKPIDKVTGEASGEPVPIAQHPSKHVQQYHADLVTVLDEIANPPQPLKLFKEAEVGTLDELAEVFPPKPFGTTVNKVHSNEKLGFWVVLGGAQGAADKFKPAKVQDFTPRRSKPLIPSTKRPSRWPNTSSNRCRRAAATTTSSAAAPIRITKAIS